MALTIHEPLAVGGNVAPLDGQLQIGQHLNHLQQGPILVRAVHLQTEKSSNLTGLSERERKKIPPCRDSQEEEEARTQIELLAFTKVAVMSESLSTVTLRAANGRTRHG